MGLHTNLWERALDSLSPDIQKSFDRTKTHKRDIVAAVLEEAEAKRALSLRKRWKFTKPNGEVVIVRDVLEKIISWVQRFKETGDTIIQYDPAHAALPWAAVRFLLQMTVSEVQTFAAMADDLENTARMLVRYRLFEGLYLRGSQSEIELKLEDALTCLYAEILVHLSNAVSFYSEKSITRVLKSPFRTFDEARAKSMVEREQEVDAFASLSDAETLRSLEAAFTRLSSQSSQSLSEDGFNQILEWLSVVPYYHHHQFIAQSRLPGAGQWLLKHEKFTDWKISSSSALLLLHGIPGSGKSTLCSVVVDSLLSATGANQAAAPLGYFYCANPHSEKSRRSADDIMRTLLFQLAIDTAHRTKMRDFLCSEYERQMALARAGRMDMAKLRVKDCVRLILELAEQDPLTIVLDGLDSVDESEKPTIIEALEELISKADNVVKIFVTSRSTSRSGAKPTSKFPIQITSQETQSDMEAFVDHLVENAVASKVLLEGRIRPETRHMLRHALLAGSDEMFLWAKLQLEQFCRQAVEDDIMAALQDKLPQDINLLYQESLNHIFNAGEMARNIAVRVLSCILYMKEPSTPGALLTALAAGKNSALELSQVLAMCADLVVLDTKCNVIRVAHQSVQDFLMRHEAFTPAAAHTYLASFCVEVCSRGINSASGRALEIPSEDFYIYAAMYWPVHSRIAMRLEKDTSQTEAIVGDVKLFIFDEDWETTLCFDTWVGNVRNLIPILSRDHAMNPALGAVPQSDLGFLFVLSIFGLDCILREALLNITDVDVNQKNELGHTPVYLAAALGEPETVSTLVDCGANVNVNCGKYGSPLHAACFMGHLDVVDKLLQLGAEVSCGSVFKNAMQAACRGGREDVALLLIGLDSMIESEDDYEEALGEATLVGFVRVVQRLHLSRFASPITKSSDKTKKKIERSIQGGQVGVLRQFLGHSAGNGNLLPSDAVARATLHNHRDLVEFLLGQGMDVEAEGDFGSPLRTASLLNYQSLVRLLLDKGAQIDSYGPFGDSLQAAALNGHTSIVRLLIQEGAKVDQKTGFYGSALQAAAYHGHANAVELLLDAQGEICGPEVVEDAFHAAAEGGHQGIITLMLRKGFKFYYPPAGPYCNVTITPSPYEALLGNASPRRHQRRDQLASRQNSETENKDGTKRSITNMDAIFRATLSDFGPLQSGTGEDSNINETSHTRHHSALSAAASLGHEDAVKVILEQQEVLCISSETVDRAAVDAAANGQMAIVYLLLDRVASRRPVKPLIEQALVVAHHRRQANVVEGVLSLASQHCSEKELSELKRKIYTAAERVQSGELSRESLVADFAYGCEIGDIQTVTAILDGKHHELFSRREVDGGLQIGALYGNATLVELLLKSPALRDRLPESGEEVFVLAAAGGFVQVMRLLGSHWDQLLMPATDAVRRALTVASQHGHLDVASYLILELGADVNTESPDKGFGSMLSQYGYLPGDHYPFSHGPPELVARHQMQQSKEEGVSTISPLYAALRGFSRFDPSERMYPSSIAIEDEVKKANRNQQEELVMFLLGKGADVKFRAGQRLFPVQVAAKYCSERVLGMFFSVGADVNALGDPECRDELPIFFIARRELSTLSLVRQFVAAGAVVSKSLEEQTHLLEQTLRSFEGNISRKVFHSSIHLHDDRFLSASSLEYIFKEGPAAALFFMLSRMPQVQTTEVRWTLVLQMAAVLDDQCYVELLLRRGTDVNGTGYYYGTALQAAARFGNVKTMQKLLDAGAQVNLLQGLWQTPLRAALVHGSESTVQMLIDNGADVKLELFSPNDLYSASEAKLMSVLQLGVETRTLGIVERLLAEGVDPNHPVMMPQHPLIIAAKYGDFNIVKSLIASGALVDVKGKKRWSDFYMVPDEASPLHAASAGGHLDVIKLLLSCGATVDSSVENSGTPLKVASMNGQTKVVRHLLSVGAKADDEGALKSAVRNNHVEVVRELLAGGAIAATVLTTACRLGYLKMVETLVERVLDTEGSRTVLDEAFAVAGDQVIQLLLSYTSPTMVQFLHVCAAGSLAAVEHILDEGQIDVNQPGEENGDYPLQVAALHLQLEIVSLLVSRGGKIECKSAKHGSPLISALEAYAAPVITATDDKRMINVVNNLRLPASQDISPYPGYHGSSAPTSFLRLLNCEKIFKLLVAHGADVSGFQRPLGSPLHVVCALGNRDMTLCLLENGASLDETSGHFEKAIFAAIYGRNTDVISLLLAHTPLSAHTHPEYGTALHYACAIHDGTIVRMLLAYGADVNAKDFQGRTPLTVALQNESVTIMPDHSLIESLLEVLTKLGKGRVCDEDLVAVSNTGFFNNTETLRLLLSLDEDLLISEDTMCRILGKSVSQETINLLMERNGFSVTKRMLLATDNDRVREYLLGLKPNVKFTAEDLISQRTLKSMELLLGFDPEIRINEEVVLRALELGHEYDKNGYRTGNYGHRTRLNEGGNTLESLFQREPHLSVTQDMLRVAGCESDMETLLKRLQPETKISDAVIDSISRLNTGNKRQILRLLMNFDSSIQISPRLALRFIGHSWHAFDMLMVLLEHNPSMAVTPNMFLRVFKAAHFHRPNLVELLHKHEKRVVFTEEVREAIEDAYRLESETAQKQQFFSIRAADTSHLDAEEE